LNGILAEVGYADAVIARECPDGSLQLIDGHLRCETTPDMFVPVLVTDLDEAEAKKLLLTLDPLAEMAEANSEKLSELLKEVQTSNEDLSQMLGDLAKQIEAQPADLKDLDVPKALPRMTWVLIGVPTENYGSIAETVERIAADESILMQITNNEKYVAEAGQREPGSEAGSPTALPR
jgi:DNA repair exonuclease SbcCD ATPase subunit